MTNLRDIFGDPSSAVGSSATNPVRDALQSGASRRPRGQVYETVVVVWLTLSVASVVLAAATWARLSRQLNDANAAVALRLEADSIFELLLEAKSSQRGFAITGNSRFLDSFGESATMLASRCDHLAGLAHDDPALLQRVAEFRQQAEASFHHQQLLAQVAQEQGQAAAFALMTNGEDKHPMAELRQDMAALGPSPSALVFNHGAGARAQLTRASLTSLVAGILGLGAGLFAFALSRCFWPT